MTNEEAFFVVVGVDEPAGDAVGAVAAYFAGGGVEHVDAFHFHLNLAIGGIDDVNIRFAEDNEQVAFAGVLEVIGHVQVGVHTRLEHGDATEFVELGGVGFKVEGAGNQHIEIGITGFAGCGDEIHTRYGAELGADEDGGAFLYLAFHIAAFATDQLAWPCGDAAEADFVFFMRLLHAGGFEVFQNHLRKGLRLTIAWPLFLERLT